MDAQQPQTPPQEPAAAPTPAASQPSAPPKTDAETNKWYGVIAYLGILCLVPLLAAKSSPFAQHHAKQGLVLFIGSLVLAVVVPFLPGIIGSLVGDLGNLAIFILSIIGIIHAWKGDLWEAPLFGDLAKKIKL